jgi:aryl-alcohol dehydrogenase-like predicted oxidoreductase
VKDSTAILDRYLERGGNFIDTANMYTFGHSETIIGEHLGARRDRVVIATKFFTNLNPGDPNGGGKLTEAQRTKLDEAAEAAAQLPRGVHGQARRLDAPRTDPQWRDRRAAAVRAHQRQQGLVAQRSSFIP